MQVIKDLALNGTAILLDDNEDGLKASDLVADDSYHGGYFQRVRNNFGITDQGLSDDSTLADLYDAARRPWLEGLAAVEAMLAELQSVVPPQAQTVRRTPRWDETTGEVDVDRAMSGQSDMYRTTRRTKHVGPETVVLLANMANACAESNYDVFWKGAALVAAVDILEGAGYACEVWGWIHWKRSVQATPPDTFIAQRIKDAGNPVDLDGMTKMVSAWYQRLVMMKVSGLAGRLAPGCGQSVETPDVTRNAWVDKYIDTAGTRRLFVPAPNYYSYDKKSEAVRITRKVIEGVVLSESTL